MDNKSVLISGAAKRIGKAIALHMAKNGWNVAIHYYSSATEAEKLIAQIKELGVEVVAVQGDLSNEQQLRAVVNNAVTAIGPLSCLINNASVLQNDNLQNLTNDVWQENITVNLYAPMILAQEFVKQLGQGRGNIINMLDYCVWNLPDKFLSYSLSKYGLWGATQILAKQLAPNIRVNGIGLGHSLRNDRESEEYFAQVVNKTPLQQCADTDEICQAVDFILNAKSMTGQMLALDGGKHLEGAEYY